MKSLYGIIAVVLGAIAILLLLPGPPDAPQPITAITDVRVFDGERLIEETTILLAAGQVARLDPELDIPENAEVIDGQGRTVIPGLIDAHVHTWGEARADALRMGVTTLLDMFRNPVDQMQVIGQRQALHSTAQADVFSAGYLATAESGHGTQFGFAVPVPESVETAAAWVSQRLEEGSDYIKIIIEDGSTWNWPMPTLEEPMIKALVEAAHAQGVLAVAHVSTQEAARMAVQAGVDGLVHLFADQPVDDVFLDLAREAGIWIVPTTPVLAAMHGQALPDWLSEPGVADLHLSQQQRTMLAQSFPGAQMRSARWPVVFENIRRVHAAGIPLLAGSDAGNPGTAHGPSLHHELALLVEAGLEPIEALRSATSIPAREFSLEGRGCLQPGCRADLLLIDGDPTVNIAASTRILSVWKNGYRVAPD